MINQEKVRDMTKMAAYENGDGEKDIQISSYRRQDYVALQMIKSFVFGTIAYGILGLFWMAKADKFLGSIDSLDTIFSAGRLILILYAVFLGIYLTFAFFWARKKYDASRARSKGYFRWLRRVAKSYRTEDEKEIIE